MACSFCGFASHDVEHISSSPSPFESSGIYFEIVREADLEGFSLLPEEREALGTVASEKRKIDFRLGRAAAHRALTKLDIPANVPILRGESREPLWPEGIVGSIAHASGYGIAAVSRQTDCPTIGVDIQKIEERYTDHLISRFADPDEFDWVCSDTAKRTERAVRLFSAKESVFKALYPIGKVWFAFDVAHLTPCESEDRFHATVRLPAISQSAVELEVGVVQYKDQIITGATVKSGTFY